MNIPKSLEILKDFLSEEEIILFAEYYAGRTIYIPKKLKKNHPLLACGEEIASKLITYYAGITLSVPMLSRLKEFRRNSEIHQYRQSGWTISLIAQYFQLSSRHIFVVLKNAYPQN